jgi:glucokinase
MSLRPSSRESTDADFVALGIDVGGTKIAAGVVCFPEGAVRMQRVIPTRAQRGAEAVLKEVQQMAADLAGEARARQWTVQGIGVGVCELVDRAGQIVSANCFDWRKAPVREGLALLAPTLIEADVRAAALGEALFGAGKPFQQFLYVTVGTGISSCLMPDGRPFLGARGLTGTMASSPLPVARDGAGAGNPTLEELASGPALVKRFNQRGGSAQSAPDVLAAAATGNADALDVVRSGAEALGAAIGWLGNVLDPGAIVIGGGLGVSEGLHRETLIASARRHIWSDLNRDLPVLPAALGLNAGTIGAAAAAWRSFGPIKRKAGHGVGKPLKN